MSEFRIRLAALAVMLAFFSSTAAATDMSFKVAGDDKELLTSLQSASLTWALRDQKSPNPQDVLGAAQADYRGLVETLYAGGYYGGTVRILLDNTEASSVDIFSVPKSLKNVRIAIDPGPPFRFDKLNIGPVSPGLEADPNFRSGKPARSTAIEARTLAVIDGWRAAGHPKAAVVSQSVVADHLHSRVSVDIRIDPGPQAVFGDIVITGDTKVSHPKIRRIAGVHHGDPYSPETLALVETRLRRVAAFSSVVITEAPSVAPDGSLDITVNLTDRARHRFGFGAELATVDGLGLSGFWLNRNLLGSAELLRVDAEVKNLRPQDGGTDYTLSLRAEDPARRRPDTVSFYKLTLESLDEPTFTSDSITLGFGYSRIFDAESQGEVTYEYSHTEATDDLGNRTFDIFSVPLTLSLDRRDNKLDPRSGTYYGTTVTPFYEFGDQVTGLRATLDARRFFKLGNGPLSLALRGQLGTLLGAQIGEVEPDMLFYSGGGGTVRGQAYQSLGVTLPGGDEVGGRSIAGASAELRARIKGDYGAALFADAGYVGAETFPDGSGNWHAGAGIGFRYFTSLGPFRADLAWPVAGDTSGSVQLYIGIGQAF